MSLISAAVGIVSPPAGLALKALGWLKGYMAKHWQLTLAVVGCAAFLWIIHINRGLTADNARKDAANAALIQASRINHAEQVQVNHAPAVISAAIARNVDAQSPEFIAAVRRAADAHRLPAKAGCFSPASVPGTDRAAPRDDGPIDVADMVSRPKADDDKLVAAAGRAVEMHQAALDLIASGVAIATTDQTAAH